MKFCNFLKCVKRVGVGWHSTLESKQLGGCMKVSAAVAMDRRSLVESLAAGGIWGMYFLMAKVMCSGEVLGKWSSSGCWVGIL